jgi:hypothetical protein
MKLLALVLLIPISIFAQKTQAPDTCFTQQELIEISNMIDSLVLADEKNISIIAEYKILVTQQDTLIKLNTTQISYKDTQIKLLQDNIDLYVEREKSLHPKWYNKKSLWFGAGFASAFGVGILVNQLIK